MSLFTTIAVSFNTREKLQELGKKGESFNDVIRRLIGLPKEERK
jgi:predicted CopG family antitoxin